MFLFAVNIVAQINFKSKSNHDPVDLAISEIKSQTDYLFLS